MMTGHHVRMQTTTNCRCTECSAEFVPDPRIGNRQVTCGKPECQRARHAKQCQRWHAANKDTAANHYRDVVVPFRQRQPDYQRRWRWRLRLGEIREKMSILSESMMAGLRALVRRAEAMLQRNEGTAQTGVLAGETLHRAMSAVCAAVTALEHLQARAATLEELGV